MSRYWLALWVGLGTLSAALPISAQEIYCTITGSKQGELKSTDSSSQIPVLFLTEEVSVPYDATSGAAAGKPSEKPLTIVKELDATSPQLFAAAVTNEVFPAVACTFYRTSQTGARQAYFRISLTDATIVEYKDSGDGANGDSFGDERERVSFIYRTIVLTDLSSGTTATDDWIGP